MGWLNEHGGSAEERFFDSLQVCSQEAAGLGCVMVAEPYRPSPLSSQLGTSTTALACALLCIASVSLPPRTNQDADRPSKQGFQVQQIYALLIIVTPGLYPHPILGGATAND